MENQIYINDLEELEEISDSLVFPSIFEEKEEEFLETCFLLMDEYLEQNPHAVSEPDFMETFQEEIEELFYSQWEEEIFWNDQVEEDLNDLLEIAFEIYFSIFSIHRSTSLDYNFTTNTKKKELQDKIDYLKSKPQPTQRTEEWYKFRYNLITASNAYKAFESQSMMNQLIYEKCLPLKVFDSELSKSMVNTNTTLHWGQKYEPLSVLIYEEMYKTKIDDFGCIQHNKYSFLGASPDGINVDQLSERFGRMLEIKNIVNREITGIPKKEYWIQMQLQMEVCDLEECDFLETKFTEYSDATNFYQDYLLESDSTSKINVKQGIILYFHTINSTPHYVYKPLNIVELEKIEEWSEMMVNKYESKQFNMLFIKHIYWKLEKLSCVLVTRNKKWFQDNIGQIENIWRIIEKERISGYQHRAPNKRQKTEQSNKITSFFQQEEGCLINLNKIKVTKLSSDCSDLL
jgi:putative phage-type endonuclease